jgi:V8-like Glu-specific endopeptidase
MRGSVTPAQSAAGWIYTLLTCRINRQHANGAGAGGSQGVGMRRAGGVMRNGRARPVLWAGSALAVPALGALLLSPAGHGAARFAARLAVAAATLSSQAPWATPARASGHLFEGVPEVGALFRVTNGGLGRHFCTATVVDSPVKDLVITAAHCVSGQQPGEIAFVPAYRNGSRPYGTWVVRRIIVDAAWQRNQNPNRDVAFLVVGHPGQAGVQHRTGGVRLGTGWPSRTWVHVLGYPDGSQWPLICANRTRPFGPHQLEFDCGGYIDGTSGGPFVARWNAATGTGTVIGVIGGYEQGGYLAAVSYSPRFRHAIRWLYRTAVADARATG